MITPYPFQEEASNSIFDYYMAGHTGNPVIALPTASGKSVVIADFLRKVFMRWPRQRAIVATHVKELVRQNADRFLEAWPEAPIGIYSAGLGEKQSAFPIVFGGIQSMVSCSEKFLHRDLLLVDECHLISSKENGAAKITTVGNYGKFIGELKRINPNLKVIGFSATPWRLGHGKISDGPLFTDTIYDLTGMEAFNKLIAEGYLCMLIPKRTSIELDVSNVAVQAGDYVQAQLQAAVDKDKITYAACKEIVEQGYDRRSWVVFASGVEHSEHIATMLQSFGIDCLAVHSKMDDKKRDKAIKDWKEYKIRCLVNYGILTTGINHPGLDLIGMLRPTKSPVLWVQMLGRGTRTNPGKPNCLVLDFAGNTKRLGPINDPVIPKRKGQKKGGVAPIRICDKCGTYNHARAAFCCLCGEKFEAMPQITKHAGTDELIRQASVPVFAKYQVDRVIYNTHQKAGSLPIMKVSYFVKGGLQMFNEWVCLEHTGIAGRKAREWWRARMPYEPPPTVDVALKYVSQLKVPHEITVRTDLKYIEVVGTTF